MTHEEKRESWLRIKDCPERDKHPALYKRTKQTEKITTVKPSDHGTVLVTIENGQTLDCLTLENIRNVTNEETAKSGCVLFDYIHFFTKEEMAELEEDFKNGRYDDLGDDVIYA